MSEIYKFFNGFPPDRVEPIIQGIKNQESPGKIFKNSEEFQKLMNNSTIVFKQWTIKDISEFNEVDETHEIFLHFIGGYNIKGFLEASNR